MNLRRTVIDVVKKQVKRINNQSGNVQSSSSAYIATNALSIGSDSQDIESKISKHNESGIAHSGVINEVLSARKNFENLSERLACINIQYDVELFMSADNSYVPCGNILSEYGGFVFCLPAQTTKAQMKTTITPVREGNIALSSLKLSSGVKLFIDGNELTGEFNFSENVEYEIVIEISGSSGGCYYLSDFAAHIL